MFDGNLLWKPLISLDMEQKYYCNRPYSTYRGLPNDLYTALVNSAQRNMEKVCIVDSDDSQITYGEFLARVDQLASFLRENEYVKYGDHVALMMYNSAAFCISFLALIKLGAVTLPLPSKFRQQEVLSLIDKAEPTCILCDADFAPWMSELKERSIHVLVTGKKKENDGLECILTDYHTKDFFCMAKAEDPAVLMFTSGTTSMSKGVVLSNFNIMHAVASYQITLDLTPEDSTVIAVPIYHVTGMIALLGLFLYVGASIWIQKKFNAEQVLMCVKENHLTFIHASPTVFSLLLQEAGKYPSLPSLRAFACGSSNMPKEKIRALHQWLPHTAFRTVYGLTETSSPATIFPCDAATSEHIGSSGIPIPGTVFRIIDESGNELPVNQIGEVQIKGSVVLREYYRLQTTALSDDGWLSTGDLGYFTPDGYLFLTDRKKDMINRGGEKICSYDVENELYKLYGIDEAAVVGIQNELYGEVAAAVVKCASGVSMTAEDIQKSLHDRLAKYKIPVKICFVDEIPTTPNGKINKKLIREMLQTE